ncbi:MAG: rod shape-determining protein MreD [Bacteroidales bacterium]|nr:rod shape-determining protein MreD [Bacteroidales bacterium]
MTNRFLKYGFVFIVLILLQVLLFNNIEFSGYVNPYVYVMFILILPLEIPAWVFLIISFLTGLTVDIFTGSLGIHTSASLFAGFCRPYVLRLIAPRDGYESGAEISMGNYGLNWFLIYAVIIVLIHHTVLFYFEVFRFKDFFRTLLRVIFSSAFTLAFIMLGEYYRSGKKR